MDTVTVPSTLENPDQYADVAGDKIHFSLMGTETDLPAVVLEAGNSCVLSVWNHVCQQLKSSTLVLSYERAGVGSSEGHGAGAAEVAARLSALLDAVKIRKPVVLVGHSIGGLYARYYAATRHRDVAGLVLLDATPEDLRIPRRYYWLPKILVWSVHLAIRTGFLGHLEKAFPKLKLLAGMKPDHVAAMGRVRHVRATMGELSSLNGIQQVVASAKAPAGLPILCISAGTQSPGTTLQQFNAFRTSHDKLADAGEKPWSGHVRVAGGTHMTLLTDPVHAAAVGDHILKFAGKISDKLTR
jgi:pimeloyl-ACP methyl ester carboxylesterase